MSTRPFTLPALPIPEVSNGPWPTFSIPIDERQAISSGRPLQMNSAPTGISWPPVPPIVVNPPISVQDRVPSAPRFLRSISLSPDPATSPGFSSSPNGRSIIVSAVTPGSPPRSIPVSPPAPVYQPPPTAMQLPPITPWSQPTPPMPSVLSSSTPTSASSWNISTISLVVGLFSGIASVFVVFPAVASWVAVLCAGVAVVTGIIALRTNGIVGTTRKEAGWGITIALIVALIQITRVVLKF